MNTPPNRQYSRFIVAPDVWPTTRQECEAKATVWQTATDTSTSAADTHRAAINGLRAYGVAQSIGFEAMHAAYWRNQIEADDLTDIRSAAADLMQNVSRIQQGSEQRIDSIDADAHQQLAIAPRHSPMAICIISEAAALVRTTATDAANEITALSGNFAARFGPVPESPGKDLGRDSNSDGGERPSPPTKSKPDATADDFGGPGRPDAPAGQAGIDSVNDGVNAAAGFGGERPYRFHLQQWRRLHHQHHLRSETACRASGAGGYPEGRLRYPEAGVSAASEEGCRLPGLVAVCRLQDQWGRQHHRRQHLRRRFRECCL